MSDTSGPLRKPVVSPAEAPVASFAWGAIHLLDCAETTGSETLTFGVVDILAGQANPRHYHPNCDEVLYVLAGRIHHTLGDEEYTLETGDVIHIPQGIWHQARAIGDRDARVIVAFNSGRREVVGEF